MHAVTNVKGKVVYGPTVHPLENHEPSATVVHIARLRHPGSLRTGAVIATSGYKTEVRCLGY